MNGMLTAILNAPDAYVNVFGALLRWVAPLIAFILLLRCVRPLLTFRREPEIWAWLCFSDEKKLPITHWENIIGRSKHSDIVIDFPTISRNHAVLTRYDDGSWTISDAGSKDGVFVNGKRVSIRPIRPQDVISMGGVDMTLQPISLRQEQKLAKLRTKGASVFSSFLNVFLLSVLQKSF